MERTVLTAHDVRSRLQPLAAPFLAAASGLGIQKSQLDVEAAVATPIPEPDDYKSRLLKYIPTEVVAVYLTIAGIVHASGSGLPRPTLSVVFVVLLVATPLYLWRVLQVTKAPQLAVSTVSFAVWVFTLGGPFASAGWYRPAYGAILLPLYTFMVPILYQG
ncbi:MAG TPA: hypothetical protein VGS20_17495 [Candidatus Acidoferrales bacterium]|nr:hypothetical protein [Candidatus Acidoferrales bacterium]